jgi:hypothetical protein
MRLPALAGAPVVGVDFCALVVSVRAGAVEQAFRSTDTDKAATIV